MARGDQLVRQWELLKVLQANRFGISIDELVEKMDCTRRTVERDLSVLKKVKFPVECQERDFGKKFWKLDSNFTKSDSLLVGVTEMVSFHLAGQLLAPLAGTHLGDGLDELGKKIRKVLPKDAYAHFRSLQETLYVRMPVMEDLSKREKELDIIRRAIDNEQEIIVNYKGAYKGKPSIIQFQPYGIVVYGVSVYIFGYSVTADGTRMLKIARMSGVQMTDKKFKRPEDFSLEKCFGYSFGIITGEHKKMTITCKFTGWAATHIREIKWHKTQVIEKDTGEEITASFLLDSTIEFIRWLSGFGARAWVVSPRSVRDEMTRRLKEAIERYEK
jgi:predicted DNA-binding transcriptional regulator YafY